MYFRVPLAFLQAREYEACLAAAASSAEARGLLTAACSLVLAEGSEEDGFHLYYTSGTTGVPKGVMLSHRIVVLHAVGTISGGLLLQLMCMWLGASQRRQCWHARISIEPFLSKGESLCA